MSNCELSALTALVLEHRLGHDLATMLLLHEFVELGVQIVHLAYVSRVLLDEMDFAPVMVHLVVDGSLCTHVRHKREHREGGGAVCAPGVWTRQTAQTHRV